MTALHSLEKSELALSTLDYTRRYALTRQEQILPRRLLVVDGCDDSRALPGIVWGT